MTSNLGVFQVGSLYCLKYAVIWLVVYPIHEGDLLFFGKRRIFFFFLFFVGNHLENRGIHTMFFQATGNIPGFFGVALIDGNEQTATAAMSR